MQNSTDKDEATRINRIIQDYSERLNEISTELLIESAGVSQAVDALRKALDKVEQCQKDRRYEEVANLGYRDVSSEFIFLQRTMGSLLTKSHERSSLISDIACEAKVAYENVEPLVEKSLQQSRTES